LCSLHRFFLQLVLLEKSLSPSKISEQQKLKCACRNENFSQVNYTVQSYFNDQPNAQFPYSITICMLHYNPRHVSSINMPIFSRTNCIITASGIVTLCKMPDESRQQSSLLSSGILYCTVPDAVIIQFVLLKMGILMLETCRGL
jgi:hypothetical protein